MQNVFLTRGHPIPGVNTVEYDCKASLFTSTKKLPGPVTQKFKFAAVFVTHDSKLDIFQYFLTFYGQN